MIYVFWVLAAPTGALATILIVMSLAGSRLSAVTPVWLTLLLAFGVIAMLVWGYHMASFSNRPAAACGLVLLSWLVYFVVMLANGIAHQQTWQ